MAPQRLFLDFLIIEVVDGQGSDEPRPRVRWRLDNTTSDVSESEITQFAFPYPELLKKQTSKSMAPAEEFVFVLSKAGSSDDPDAAVSRTFGFCRRAIGPGVGGHHDLGLRYPECLCILASQPLFSLFPAILKEAHGLSLVNNEALPQFIRSVCFPSPFPMRGETIRVSLPHPRIGPSVRDSELRYTMPASDDSPLWGDVGASSLLHALGARRFLLVFTALLSERRVIMVAENLRKLTVCVCSALASLQPFVWQHIFIPLLPSKLLSYACAPYPFLIGLHSSHLPEILDPEGGLALSEVIVVDLDQGQLHIAGSEGGTGSSNNADVPPVLRDMLGGGLLSPPRVVRRGADRLDGLRVKATRYIASRLEMITPADIASSVETYSEKTADAAFALSERLHSIVATHGGKASASWRLAKATSADNDTSPYAASAYWRGGGGRSDNAGVCDPEAPPAWTAPGSPGATFSSSSSSSASTQSTITFGVGPDDTALLDALLVFHLQLVGDPKPFNNTANQAGTATDAAAAAAAGAASGGPRGGASASIEAVRRRFLASRTTAGGGLARVGGGDSPGLTAFLEEFVHTQMFQCFSLARDSKGGLAKSSTTGTSTPFFLCAAAIGQFGQSYDRKSIRKVVARLQGGDNSSSSSGGLSPLSSSSLGSSQQQQQQQQSFHPVALQLTSNTPFPGDAGATVAALCRSLGGSNSFVVELGRVVRTVSWRLSDSGGLKWRHGHKALLLLRSLVLFGPEAALAEALNLLPQVKALERFKSGLPPGAGAGSGEHVRSAARSVASLLVDTKRLQRERSRHRCLPPHEQALRNPSRQPVPKLPPLDQLLSSIAPSSSSSSVSPPSFPLSLASLHAAHRPTTSPPIDAHASAHAAAAAAAAVRGRGSMVLEASAADDSDWVLNTPGLADTNNQSLLDFDAFVEAPPTSEVGPVSDLFSSFPDSSDGWDACWDETSSVTHTLPSSPRNEAAAQDNPPPPTNSPAVAATALSSPHLSSEKGGGSTSSSEFTTTSLEEDQTIEKEPWESLPTPNSQPASTSLNEGTRSGTCSAAAVTSSPLDPLQPHAATPSRQTSSTEIQQNDWDDHWFSSNDGSSSSLPVPSPTAMDPFASSPPPPSTVPPPVIDPFQSFATGAKDTRLSSRYDEAGPGKASAGGGWNSSLVDLSCLGDAAPVAGTHVSKAQSHSHGLFSSSAQPAQRQQSSSFLTSNMPDPPFVAPPNTHHIAQNAAGGTATFNSGTRQDQKSAAEDPFSMLVGKFGK